MSLVSFFRSGHRKRVQARSRVPCGSAAIFRRHAQSIGSEITEAADRLLSPSSPCGGPPLNDTIGFTESPHADDGFAPPVHGFEARLCDERGRHVSSSPSSFLSPRHQACCRCLKLTSDLQGRPEVCIGVTSESQIEALSERLSARTSADADFEVRSS